MLSKEQLEKIANPAQADIGGTQSPIITQMAIELLESRAESLSLREQVAELKALQPVAEMRTWPKNISGPNPDWFWFGKQDFPVGTQLFTAAKPAENDIAKFMAGVKSSMAQGVAEAIQKEALQIMFDEIIPDTETVAMQYESLVKKINRMEDEC
ncbi:hypothetical protein [Yersinia proxima]|uniref:hypothetical protein n=1 Tax=Yersinia proxima TaxID=2890316 RepID=UPI001D12887B|nr:hypothetical protein [Yersinia proxima]